MADNALMRGAYSTADINRGLGNVVRERGFIAPFATYGDNSTGFAWPEIIHGPASAINSLMTNPTPYLEQSPEEKQRTIGNAFEAAGTATLGSFAGSRPAGALAAGAGHVENMPPSYVSRTMSPEPKLVVRGYHGTGTDDLINMPLEEKWALGSGPWGSSSPRVAETYSKIMSYDVPKIVPLEYRFQNPKEIDAQGKRFGLRTNFRDINTDIEAARARDAGHDGLVIRNVRDAAGSDMTKADTFAPLKPGTTYSATTGDLLYANAKTGSAVPLATEAAKHQNALMQNPIRAYHGSPHDFDKFDLSKIGTGEGAQAYGHGLYFAENEGVAKSYRDVLSSGFNGRADDARAAAARAMEYHGNDKAKALADLEQNANGYPPRAELLREAQRLIETDTWKPGKMYEVSINAHPDDFLDWDKPLSQQSDKVRAAFNKWADGPEGDALAKNYWSYKDGMKLRDLPEFAPDVSANAIYRNAFGNREGANKSLLDEGVKGIRYLDQGSRTAGEGSRNYVVFDDALVEILRKYGLLGTLGAGAAASAYGAPPAEAAPTNALMRPNR